VERFELEPSPVLVIIVPAETPCNVIDIGDELDDSDGGEAGVK
jgi:hypothetical protein